MTTDAETSSPTTLMSAPTTTVTGTEASSPATASSSISTSTNTAGVSAIFVIQPGNSGYYKKRQNNQAYVGPGGVATLDCSAAAVYIVFQEQLFTNGQLISTNSDITYQLFAPSSGGVGTITTSFAIDGNNLLTWQNLTFVDGHAYFCQQGDQVNALFYGLYYQGGYPPNCEIVSLVVIPGKKANVWLGTIKLT
jgi:hypothetical protein